MLRLWSVNISFNKQICVCAYLALTEALNVVIHCIGLRAHVILYWIIHNPFLIFLSEVSHIITKKC